MIIWIKNLVPDSSFCNWNQKISSICFHTKKHKRTDGSQKKTHCCCDEATSVSMHLWGKIHQIIVKHFGLEYHGEGYFQNILQLNCARKKKNAEPAVTKATSDNVCTQAAHHSCLQTRLQVHLLCHPPGKENTKAEKSREIYINGTTFYCLFFLLCFSLKNFPRITCEALGWNVPSGHCVQFPFVST